MASEPPRLVNGVPMPPRRKTIDEQGYETTKHALRFRGEDWDTVLNKKRDALTTLFTQEAAVATGDAEENIQSIRFSIDNQGRLIAKFDVRHKALTTQSVVQDRLATYPFKQVTVLYEPLKKKRRPPSRVKGKLQIAARAERRACPNVSFFGRAPQLLGPNGLEFRDEKEEEEELPIPDPERTSQTRGLGLMG